MTWYTYLVAHPITKAPVYAGVTTDIATRRNAHTAPNARFRSSLTRKKGAMWGLVPEVVVVGSYRTKEKALDREIRLIP
jgi:predicted GIY-YIG superfamily endonuclease